MTRTADPDLRLEGFRLWIHRRERPDDFDYWDGNWLTVTALLEAPGARVEVHGTFLRTSELADFAVQVKQLHTTLVGTAELACMQPELRILLEGRGLGHIAATVELTPEPLNQSHRFRFEADQTLLRPMLTALEAILEEYPIRGSSSD